MPNTGKKKPAGAEAGKLIDEHAAIVVAISSLGRKAQRMLLLTPQQVSVLLGRKVKTLEKDRHDRREALAAGLPIDPAHPMALPYAEPAPGEREVRYLAIDVADFLAKKASGVARPKQAPAKTVGLSGFQGWLARAEPTETWPFCTLPNGRPIDMAEAIASGQLGGKAERLNLFEYSEKLATAVAMAQPSS